ncbi:hypothetical protein [Rhizobium sp. G21]|uniref:hypothetical protein n=1 Tax=Rhizobium sp. G21 TaxID=2758439 RepID=UPI001602E58E|nr:hypothetical protein [Rhizobium sp. G21]MBB1248192.1 hypothetical protein [Rhizobium sp. G21]
MKIAIIGNSHIAALKMAWTEVSTEYGKHNITFFGHRGNRIANLVLQDGMLVAEERSLRRGLKFTSGGIGRIDLKAFDAFVVHGIGVEPFYLPPDQFFSNGFRTQAAHDVMDKAPAMKLIQSIRSVSDRPVFVGHVPLAVASEISGDQSPDAFFNGMKFAEDTVFSKLKARLVLQPPETIVNGRNTDPIYKQGSTSLAVGDAWDNTPHRTIDRFHMNGEYGKRWLGAFFAML